jgi:HK97 family phage portal protein
MSSFLQRIAENVGDALGRFEKARVEATFGKASRGEWLDSYADEARWKGKSHDERAQLRAMQNAWYFSAVTMIAGEVAAATLRVMRRGMADKPPKPLPKHGFHDVLSQPNPWMDDDFLMRFTTIWLKLDGNAYWYIIPSSNGMVEELWPLPADKVAPIPGDQKNFVDYYEYTAAGRIYHIPADQVAHFINIPNPWNIFDGLSELLAGMLPIDADSAMSRWNAKFFGRDNVMPSAIINLRSGDPRKRVAANDIQAIKDDMRTDYAAFDRRTLVTGAPGGIDVHALGWSMRDLDFVLGREKTRKEIYELFGIPEGVYDKNTTEASANVSVRIFKGNVWSRTLTPLAKRITQRILKPFYGEQYFASYDDIRPEDREMVIREREQNWKARTFDEARLELGDEPYVGPYAELLGKLPVELATNPQSAVEFVKISLGIYDPQTPQAPEQIIDTTARDIDDDNDQPEPEHEPDPENDPENENENNSKAVTVHPGKFSGSVLLWYVPTEISNKLSSPSDQYPDGSHIVPFGNRHITLVYFPESPDLVRLNQLVTQYVSQARPIQISIPGTVGRFDGVEDGLFDAVYYTVDSPELREFRDGLIAMLIQEQVTGGVEFREYVPHITCAYVPPTAGVKILAEPAVVTLDAIHFAQNGETLQKYNLIAPDAIEDLKRWQEKLIRKGLDTIFTTDSIPVWLQDDIRVDLSDLSDPKPADIKSVFSKWL